MMKFEVRLKSLSKVEGCGGLGGSRLTISDKEVTKQDLVIKGGDSGACKLLGDVMVMLERCKPMVVSFRAYSMDQIIMILKQRLMALPYTVFQPQALELCARKVYAASGDMRKALGICRLACFPGAIEMLETELRENACTSNLTSMVRVDHMAIALSRAYKSPIVDTIQSLPQHQQIVLCSAVKLFRRGKMDTTIGELNKYYIDLCKSTSIPPVGIMELSCMWNPQTWPIKLYTNIFGPSLKNSSMTSEAYKEAVLHAKEHILGPENCQPQSVYDLFTGSREYPCCFKSRNSYSCEEDNKPRFHSRKVTNRPLAGTIRRGKTPKEDYMLENQLLHDEKQCAEHIMLVYLGRNDVGKVSKPGSVNVEKLMNVERYSHVMHISSTVTRELLDELSTWDALRAALHVGTVSGAPKVTGELLDELRFPPGDKLLVSDNCISIDIFMPAAVNGKIQCSYITVLVKRVKAMELINKLEVTRRRPYSGGFGGISFTGDMDISLALRTIVFPTASRYGTMYSYRDSSKQRDWVAHLQAGAGIVVDSDPSDEQRECKNKAATLARAIDLAESSFVDK
ncbi:anthranilate synthase alpha subunit 2, chloroplastic-like protein isoform X1 [Tanacetum coccineum]